jgi:hypothetical protein
MPKQEPVAFENVTKAQFARYVRIQSEGKTNMMVYASDPVMLAIMFNYGSLADKYPDVVES